MINYMSIYAHDHYVLELSLLYYMIKHTGIYLEEILSRWLHWLYDFTLHFQDLIFRPPRPQEVGRSSFFLSFSS
jgi:hypothetical protein